jgi:hypothetical protein
MNISAKDHALLQEFSPKDPRKLGCAYRLTVLDKEGNVTNQVSGENSILTNYLKLHQASFIRDGITVKCTDGTDRSMGIVHYPETGGGPYGYGTTNYTRYFDYWPGIIMTALTNNDTHGIIAGTGTTAVSPSDHTMATKIVQGTGTNQMVYRDMVVSGVQVVGSQVKQTLTRTLENLSGNSISVSEIGVVAKVHQVAVSVPVFYVQIIRDVLGTPLVIDSDSSVVIDYLVYTEI